MVAAKLAVYVLVLLGSGLCLSFLKILCGHLSCETSVNTLTVICITLRYLWDINSIRIENLRSRISTPRCFMNDTSVLCTTFPLIFGVENWHRERFFMNIVCLPSDSYQMLFNDHNFPKVKNYSLGQGFHFKKKNISLLSSETIWVGR